jgi:hypothetical protein
MDVLKTYMNDCQLIKSVINSSKPFFKEAILKCSTYTRLFNTLKMLDETFKSNTLVDNDVSLNGAYQ